jgi:hypothetical protein
MIYIICKAVVHGNSQFMLQYYQILFYFKMVYWFHKPDSLTRKMTETLQLMHWNDEVTEVHMRKY